MYEEQLKYFPHSFIRCVWVMQLLSAFAICINHLHFSLIKGLRLPTFWENQPTLLGITILAFTSGILTQMHYLHNDKHELTTEFIARRFIRLWWPIFFITMIDIHFFMADSGGHLTTSWPLLSVLTLTQTWIYNVFDGKSIPLPLGVSNLIWVGSCLFGLFVLHGVTKSIWIKLAGRTALITLLLTGTLCATYFWVVEVYGTELNAWALAKYGQLAGPYQFVNWLLLYNPYAEIGSYFCGVAFAQLMFRESWKLSKLKSMIITIFSLFLIYAPTSNFPRYLGVGLILSLLFILYATKRVIKTKHRMFGKCKRVFFKYITPITFEIIISHIMIYDLFPLSHSDETNSIVEIVLHVLIVNVLMVIILVGLHQIILLPAIRGTEKFLKIHQSVDTHI